LALLAGNVSVSFGNHGNQQVKHDDQVQESAQEEVEVAKHSLEFTRIQLSQGNQESEENS
jgi:hypothetical protein